MSSESNEDKPDSPEVPPSGGDRRPGARAASNWGAARDALAAVRNLETLLRSTSVSHPTMLDLLPELHSSADVLRRAFAPGPEAGGAAAAVSVYGGGRVEELRRLLDETAREGLDRDALARRTRTLADELEAAADLLALLERASSPAATEVGIGRIVRETSRMSGSASGKDLVVRLEDTSGDCVVTTDPYVVGSLLLLAVSSVHGAGHEHLVVRVRSHSPTTSVVVEPAVPEDAGLPAIAMRVLRVVPPVEDAARRVAQQMGVTLAIGGGHWTLSLAFAGDRGG